MNQPSGTSESVNRQLGGISLEDIAQACGGELLGDPAKRVSGVASVGNATDSDLAFLIDAKTAGTGLDAKPGVLLVREVDQDIYDGNRILVEDPYLAYAQVSGLFAGSAEDHGSIHATSDVDATASVGSGVTVGAGAVIEKNCTIGDDTVIEAGAIICSGTRIGRRCTISPGAVIGSSGFGYAPSKAGWQKIYQLGGVQIGDDVDVGSNTTIDRGAIDSTVIGDRVKIDNHVQIAHNVQVGDDTIMAAFVGIAGSAKIGKRCQFGGRSSIMGHITICDDVVVHTNTFVARSIDEPGTFSSMLPAQPASQWRKTVVLLNRLEKIAATVKKMGARK